MINIYLDDYRPCPQGFVAAKTSEECILLLEAEKVDVISLDFDLGWGQPTGLKVVEHIVASGRYPRTIYIHTSSPSGRLQMHHLLIQHAPPEVVIHNRAMGDG